MTYPDRSYASHPIQEGSLIQARYRVTGYLGEGGFAQVFEGRDLEIDRDVAIKAFSPLAKVRDLNQREQLLERFRMEARTAAKIRHPNVVTIHDIGVTDELLQPYIVMELLHGHDMEKELKYHGPMTPRRALPLFCECLEALGEGHQAGVIHKDLKPSNLYLTEPHTRRESLRIVDFGIARLGTDKKASRITGPNQILGTPQYYAPEYVRQQLVTPALDVYQMGLILVEMLTGRKVVASDDPYVCLNRHCDGDLDIPKALMDSPLGTVLRRALARNVRERYQDAHAFCDALTWISPKKVPSWARPGAEALVKGGGTKELDLDLFKGRGAGPERPRRGTMELDGGGGGVGGARRHDEGGRGRRRGTFSLVSGGRSEREPDGLGSSEQEHRPRTRRQRLRRLEGSPLEEDVPLALADERRLRRERLDEEAPRARRARDEGRGRRERGFDVGSEWDDAPRARRSRRGGDEDARSEGWSEALDDGPDGWEASRPARHVRGAEPRRRASESQAFYDDEADAFMDDAPRPRRKRKSRKKRGVRREGREASSGPSTAVFEAPARERRAGGRGSTTAAMEVRGEAPARRRAAQRRTGVTATASLGVEPLEDAGGPITAVFDVDEGRGPKTATMDVGGFEDEGFGGGGIHGATTASLTVETVVAEPAQARRKQAPKQAAPKPKPKPKPEALNEGDIVINLDSAQQRRRKVSASTTASLNVDASTVVLTLGGGGHGNDRSGIAPAISGEVVVSMPDQAGRDEDVSEAQSPKTIVLDLGLSREAEAPEAARVEAEAPEAARVEAVTASAAPALSVPADDPDVALIAGPARWSPEEAYAAPRDVRDRTSRVALPEPKRDARRGRWAAVALLAAVLLVVFGVVSWQGLSGDDEASAGGDALLAGAEANAMPPSREGETEAGRAPFGGGLADAAGGGPAMAMNDAAGGVGLGIDAAPAGAGDAGEPSGAGEVVVDSDAALLEAPELPIYPPLKGDPPVDAIFVKIVPDPVQAVVSYEDHPIGQGPVVLMLKPGERERMKITLTHKGYVRKIITVRPSHAPELVLQMKEPSEVYDTTSGERVAAPSAAAKAAPAANITPMPRKAPIKVGSEAGLLIAH